METTSGGWGIGDYPDHLSVSAGVFSRDAMASGITLSAYRYSYLHYSDQTAATEEVTVPEPVTQADTPVYTGNEGAGHENAYTISVDEVVIDGKKETVVTRVVEEGDRQRVVADSE